MCLENFLNKGFGWFVSGRVFFNEKHLISHVLSILKKSFEETS